VLVRLAESEAVSLSTGVGEGDLEGAPLGDRLNRCAGIGTRTSSYELCARGVYLYWPALRQRDVGS
jgi:hypothetical protein